MKKPFKVIHSFPLLAALLVGGCEQASENSYFPLEEGMSWEYQIEYSVKEEMKTQRLIYSTRPAVDLDDERYYLRASLNGHRDYYQKKDEGIVHVDPISGDRTQILAYPVKQGRQWQADSHIQLLEVTGAFTPTFEARITNPITMDYHIENTGETITVSAGTFDNCIRVKGKGRLFAGLTLQDYMGIDGIYIEETEWYAPGVGLIKTVREEYTEPNEFKNTYTQELLSVTRR